MFTICSLSGICLAVHHEEKNYLEISHIIISVVSSSRFDFVVDWLWSADLFLCSGVSLLLVD